MAQGMIDECRVLKRNNNSLIPKKNRFHGQDLASKGPELAKQWHPTRNGSLKPSDVSWKSNSLIWWLCPKSCDSGQQECVHEWPAKVSDRGRGQGCCFCSGRITCCMQTSLATVPRAVELWDYEKNYPLRPEFCRPGSKLAVWLLCPKTHRNEECRHSWKTDISSFFVKACNCQYCEHKSERPCCTNSSLAANHLLAAEWHCELNTKRPRDYWPSSGERVSWKCRFDENHVWEATIHDRTKSGGCRFCNSSRLELAMKTALEELRQETHTSEDGSSWKISSITQQAQMGRYSCDFTGKVISNTLNEQSDKTFCIETDGEQHFMEIKRNSHSDPKLELHKNQYRDRKKVDLCRQNNIPILRIAFNVKICKYKKLVIRFIKAIMNDDQLTMQAVEKPTGAHYYQKLYHGEYSEINKLEPIARIPEPPLKKRRLK